jgi:hypothetical protein
MDGTKFTLARSSLCLVLISASARDVPAQVVDGEAFTPLVNDSYKPVENPLSNMTLSALRLTSTSLTDSSVALNSSDIYAQDQYLIFSK